MLIPMRTFACYIAHGENIEEPNINEIIFTYNIVPGLRVVHQTFKQYVVTFKAGLRKL